MKKYGIPLAVSVLLFLLPALVATEPTYSRHRWKEEQARWGARFSGGVRKEPPSRPSRKLLLEAIQAPAGIPPSHRRVSVDILGWDGGPAQPETQSETHLAIDPERDTSLLGGYHESRFVDGGARALTYAWSTDAGRTWREALLPGATHASGGPFERGSDPWVAFGPGGRAYYATILFNETSPENGIFVSASADGGRTWGLPVAVRTETVDFGDKEAMTVDTFRGSPFRGRIYVGWDTVASSPRSQVLRVAHSSDGGASWSAPVDVDRTGVNIGCVPIVGPGGVVHAFWAHAEGQASFVIRTARSFDGGVTWSPPVTVAALLSVGVPELRTGELPAAAVDPKTGILYVTWQDARFSPGVDQVLLSRSIDGGTTWSPSVRVGDGPLAAATFTPGVAVNGQGRVAVAYYSLQNDPARRYLVDEYVAVSKNRGQTFGRPFRVSAASWDVRLAAFSRGFFLGDYQGFVAGKRLFHPLWVATYQPSRIDPLLRQPDAYTRQVAP